MEDNSLKLKIRVLLILAGLFCNTAFNANCQEFSFREYGVRDGLPQSQAFINFQDSRGFIWISTMNGLSRFDGIDFINYSKKDGLTSNVMNLAFEDASHELWVISNQGLSKYEGDNFNFYPPGIEFEKTVFGRQLGISGEPGKVFLLSESSRQLPDRIVLFKSGIYSDYSSKYQALDSMKVRSIYYDTIHSELLIINSNEDLWSWDEKVLKKISDRKFSLFRMDRGKLLLSSGNNYFEYDDRKIIPHSLKNTNGRIEARVVPSVVDNIVEYFNGTEIINIKLPFKPAGLFIDREGTLWFSSESNIFRALSPAFITWSEEVMDIDDPWAICSDRNGNIWLGSLFSELKLFDGKEFKSRNEYKKLFGANPAFYKGSRALSNGELWLSLNYGVLILNKNSFTRLNSIPDMAQVCYIYEDPDDNKIMLGTAFGLYIIDHGVTKQFDEFTDEKLGIIEGIVKDNSGFYWMSGHKGVVKFDGLKTEKVVDAVLPGQFTYVVEKDSYGGIWVSSEEGLYYKAESDNQFRHGLPQPINKPANTLSILDKKKLIVGRITDICLIDLEKFYKNDPDYYRCYDKTDGYPGAECLDNGILRGKSGDVWILTSENLVRFNPSRIIKNPIPPGLAFTGLYYETDSLTWEPVEKNEFYNGSPSDITLKRNEDRIRITFTGISTPNPEKVQYQVLLKPMDEKWSLPFSRREVFFRNLEPGEYSLFLKGINADGVETPEPLVLNFTIKPALMETLAFRISFPLLIVVLTIVLTRYLGKRSQLRKEEKHKLKSELLRLQMSSVLKEFDPHFTFNAISSVGSLIMKNDRKAAYLYLTKLSSLLRSSLRDSSSLLKPFSEELDFVRNYCELQKLRFGERFNFSINIGEDVDLHKELPKMAIQTFVENAVKHGFENRKEGGMIEINLNHDNDCHCHKIIIRDNGIGRAESMKMKSGGTGYGIKTVSRIIDIINRNNRMKSSLEILDLMNGEESLGTEVVIIIPDSYNFNAEGLLSNMEDSPGEIRF